MATIYNNISCVKKKIVNAENALLFSTRFIFQFNNRILFSEIKIKSYNIWLFNKIIMFYIILLNVLHSWNYYIREKLIEKVFKYWFIKL